MHVRLLISWLSYVPKSKLYFGYTLKNDVDPNVGGLGPWKMSSVGVNSNYSKNNHQFSDFTVFCDWKNGNQGPPVSLLKRLFSPGASAQEWAPENWSSKEASRVPMGTTGNNICVPGFWNRTIKRMWARTGEFRNPLRMPEWAPWPPSRSRGSIVAKSSQKWKTKLACTLWGCPQ